MIAIAHFAGLVLTTIFAAAAAVLLDWLLLRAMFQLMRPATVRATFPNQGPSRKTAPTTAFSETAGPLRSIDWARDKKAGPTTAFSEIAGPLQKATPATAKSVATFRSELVNGTRELARQFGPAATQKSFVRG